MVHYQGNDKGTVEQHIPKLQKVKLSIWKTCKTDIDQTERLILLDFAENYHYVV